MVSNGLAVARRHPGRALGALGALVIAGGAAIGSGAAFTTSTVNPSNTFSSGILKVASSADGAILTAQDLVPGDVATGSVTIKNDGTVDGSAWKLTQAVTGETAGANPANAAETGQLADRLDLEVTDTTSGTTVYSGKVRAFSGADLDTIAKGASRTFGFKVTFPAGGADDNSFQGASLTTSYTWSASAGS